MKIVKVHAPGANHLASRCVSQSATAKAWVFRAFAVLEMLGLFLGLRRKLRAWAH